MRMLITLLTALASAAAASGLGCGAAAAGPPCSPTKKDTAWVWPLPGPWGRAGPGVLRSFEPPPHRWAAGHRGVDLAGRLGEPVLAPGPGTVLYAGRLVDRGVVVIGHGLLRTSYEPVAATLPVGAAVAPGEQFGTLQAGHCGSGPCLHWGLLTGRRHATTYYDPLVLLGCGQVRLEPVMAGPGSR